jgi:hypothetical protein
MAYDIPEFSERLAAPDDNFWLGEEKAVRRVISKYVAYGIRAEKIHPLIDYAIRCRSAIAHRQPIPRYS